MDGAEWLEQCEKAQQRLAERAKAYLAKHCRRLPKLTKKQKETLIQMLVAAYSAGEMEQGQSAWNDQQESHLRLSRRGINARKAKASATRQKIIAAFTANARAGGDKSVADIAAECGVSRATGYRALKDKNAK